MARITQRPVRSPCPLVGEDAKSLLLPLSKNLGGFYRSLQSTRPPPHRTPRVANEPALAEPGRQWASAGSRIPCSVSSLAFRQSATEPRRIEHRREYPLRSCRVSKIARRGVAAWGTARELGFRSELLCAIAHPTAVFAPEVNWEHWARCIFSGGVAALVGSRSL